MLRTCGLPFAEEKTETSIALQQSNTNEFVEKYVRWKALRLVLLWNGGLFNYGCIINQAIISFRQAVFF
jgi:hypothetical protein